MRALLILLLVAAALGLGGYLWFGGAKPAPALPPSPALAPAPTPAPAPAPAPAPEPAGPAPAPAATELLGKAEALAKAGKAEEAADLYRQALEADPDGKAGRKAAKALSDHETSLKRERKALGYLLRSGISGREREDALARAKALADAAFTSIPSADDLVVAVQPGETLGAIAKRHGTTPECIARINRLKDVNTVRTGQKLKVLQGSFRILVEKGERRLTLLLDGIPLRTYAVGIGTPEQPTPTGTFLIEEKVPEPPWHPPGRAPLPYGHPENILGTRWMGFKPTEQLTGYGIHGTTKDESVGQASSNGCVRMHNADVEELFDLVPRGTRVEIRD